MYELTRADIDNSVVAEYCYSLAPEQRTSIWHVHVIENALAAAHWSHKISGWWIEKLTDFYNHRVRNGYWRVGRRGGKSSTLCRVGVAEALLGQWDIPEGDEGIVAIVSKDRDDAAARLRTIETILKALGFVKARESATGWKSLTQYAMRSQEIEIRVQRGDRWVPIKFKVYAASKKGVVGMTSIMVFLDEMTKWVDVETGDNPAIEVVRSVRPSMATQRGARLFGISSAWSTLDIHYDAIEKGHTEKQRAYGKDDGQSWIVNPTLTIEGCKADSEDDIEFDREYNNIPMSAEATSFFDGDLLDLCIDRFTLPEGDPWAAADFAFRKNAAAIAQTRTDGNLYWTDVVKARFPKPGLPLKPTQILKVFTDAVESEGLMRDIHYDATIDEHLDEQGMAGTPAPVDPVEIYTMFVHFRKLITSEQWAIDSKCEQKDKAIKQLKGVKIKPVDGGRYKVILPKTGSEHGDVADAVVKSAYYAYCNHGAIDDKKSVHAKFRLSRDGDDIEETPGRLTGYTAQQWYDMQGDYDVRQN